MVLAVELNFRYFFLLAVPIFLVIFLYFFLKRRSSKFQFYFIFAICLTGFALHFLKQFFPAYIADWPYSLRTSTFENLCAVCTLVLPFFFLFGGKYLKDFIYYICIVCGTFALIVPTVTLGGQFSTFDEVLENIRYYICHYILVIVGVLMVMLNQHRLNYHRILAMPLAFLGVMSAVFINEIFLALSGLVPQTLDEFLSPDFRNASFVFGVPQAYAGLRGMIDALVFPFLRMHPYDPNRIFYLPVLWAVVPIYIAGIPLCFLLSLPFEHHHVRQDMRSLAFKIKMANILRRNKKMNAIELEEGEKSL